jgi:hypothetical protein
VPNSVVEPIASFKKNINSIARGCLAAVLHRVGKDFGVRFTKADYPAVDGTLGNLIRVIHARLGGRREL